MPCGFSHSPEHSWKASRLPPVRGSSGNEIYSLKDQRDTSTPWKPSNPDFRALLLPSLKIVLDNFPPLGTSHPLSCVFTSPSIWGKKARQEIIYLCNSRCLLKDLATTNQNSVFFFFSILYSMNYYQCLIIKCPNGVRVYLHYFNYRELVLIYYKHKNLNWAQHNLKLSLAE